MPKCVFLNIYYEQFLNDHYQRNEGLKHKSYKEQLDSIQGTMFGDSDFYSYNLKKLKGWNALDLITNCEPLQRAWAMENGVPYKNSTQVLVEQLWNLKPDVVYTQGLWVINEKVYDAIKPFVKVIAGQHGTQIDSFEAPRFDVIFTGVTSYIDEFRKAGTEAHYLGLGFDPRVLSLPLGDDEIHSVSFVGSLSGSHKRRRELLRYLCREIDVACWGFGYEGLEAEVLRNYRGEAWGPKMFSILRHSYITINAAIDFSRPWVGNMRMYEATGCGALLFNDTGMNLPDLFEPGKEIIVYESPEDCLVKIKYYLGHREDGDKIAKNGHARTMADHTYEKRMKYVAGILEKKL